jgi:hypothetical protein
MAMSWSRQGGGSKTRRFLFWGSNVGGMKIGPNSIQDWEKDKRISPLRALKYISKTV